MFNVAVELDDEFGIGFNGMCVELFEQDSYEAEIDLYKFCSNLVQPLSVLHKILKAGLNLTGPKKRLQSPSRSHWKGCRLPAT